MSFFGNHEADQRLCFRYTDSTIPLLPKSKISSLQPSSVGLQPGLCATWSETPKTSFLKRSLKYGKDIHELSHVMRKSAFCIYAKNRAVVQLCFHNTDSAISLLPKSEVSSLKPSYVTVQTGLCRTWSDTPKTDFLALWLNCIYRCKTEGETMQTLSISQ